MSRTVVPRGIVGIVSAAPGSIVSVLTAAPGRTVGILAVVVVCLLVSVAALAQPAAVQVEAVGSAADGEVEPLGFRLEGEEVVFTFDRSRYGVVTRGDSGKRVAMIDIELSERSGVAVAGEFNGWSTDAWMMEFKEPGVYELRRPLEGFGGQGAWKFKFVIDGLLWVEPPASAPNVKPTGFSNDSFNLVLWPEGPPPVEVEVDAPKLAQIDSPLLERLTLPESQLPESCSLKPLDHAVGAMPIPVDSNPMITSDRRVIGFVSVFVMPPTPEEEAVWEAETSTLAPGAVMKRIEELMAERTSTVRAAYVAIYETSARGPETGVFALEFAEPLTPSRREALSGEGPSGVVLAGEWVAAAVWTDYHTHACLDAVRAHVESVLGE